MEPPAPATAPVTETTKEPSAASANMEPPAPATAPVKAAKLQEKVTEEARINAPVVATEKPATDTNRIELNLDSEQEHNKYAESVIRGGDNKDKMREEGRDWINTYMSTQMIEKANTAIDKIQKQMKMKILLAMETATMQEGLEKLAEEVSTENEDTNKFTNVHFKRVKQLLQSVEKESKTMTLHNKKIMLLHLFKHKTIQLAFEINMTEGYLSSDDNSKFGKNYNKPATVGGSGMFKTRRNHFNNDAKIIIPMEILQKQKAKERRTRKWRKQ
jgi:hypothetical protein